MQAPGNPDAGALAALVLLQRKGRVQDAMIDAFAAVRQRVVGAGRSRAAGSAERHDGASSRGSRSARPRMRGPRNGRARSRELEARKEQLEATLSEHSAEFRAQMQPVTLEAVQAAMPDDAALLEFAVFRPFDPKAERNAEAYGPPHYAAYVIRKHGDAARRRSRSPPTTIDQLIDALRAGACAIPARRGEGARARGR